MPQLHFHEGGSDLFVHVLRSGRTVLGRSDHCDVALPSDAISRVHCIVEERRDGWWLVDRSRHGTHVNGTAVEALQLKPDDEITLGPYRARFSVDRPDVLQSPTATAPAQPAIHEELVQVDTDGVAALMAHLRITKGPRHGELVQLVSARTRVGGPGATVQLDNELPGTALTVRVVRGRPMIEPGEGAAFLAGERVREVTPAMPGEEVRIGEHAFVIELNAVHEASAERDVFGDMVGNTSIMRRLFGVLQRVASHEAPVLLTGESGTGKELAARGLHDLGGRCAGQFVAVNCAAIAENLVESQLFGHERGAFTGATERTDGAFQRAAGGTLFLDEIGEMRLDLQAKLLRALESGEVRRVGGSGPEFPDVRLVAATNRHLPQMVQQGAFRQDLYFRLAVLTVRLPPLRERSNDIPALAQTLLRRHHPGARLSERASSALCGYPWPGNVRELRNVLTRAVVMGGPEIGASDLEFNPWSFDAAPEAEPEPRNTLRDRERALLADVLRECEGNRTHAARKLGIPRSSLLYRLNKHGL